MKVEEQNDISDTVFRNAISYFCLPGYLIPLLDIKQCGVNHIHHLLLSWHLCLQKQLTATDLILNQVLSDDETFLKLAVVNKTIT